MKGKFMVYALVVTMLSTAFSWGRLFASASNSGNPNSRGSSWTTNTGGGGGAWGGGAGGGGHK
jgi:uncharacterized membrane protein